MDGLRHITLSRLCLAALVFWSLVANGLAQTAVADGSRGESSVVIAGTVITLCRFGVAGGGDDSGGSHAGHGCDQCALRHVSPALEQPFDFLVRAGVSYPPPALVSWRQEALRQERGAKLPRGPPEIRTSSIHSI